ncbi:class I SAM-dependent methyltransferase [Amycolatopsis sp. YIM 10]|uniref:class I SAM-dependent methyltransferase n=1 Tax=Amycolatopsis sp. YIM 10 TaxID=2653857 RepID=UPI0012901C94|nr:class I SAM-dependent methyltransferase [Amycolatopsis sp. YIM 10]QFU91660.1 putative S-adenosylmethionine-dependent methyltransferase [Amycolatopsis sp. YIM 10]
MLTIDFARFPIGPGDRVLDVGCGSGRHAVEAHRRGATALAVDLDEVALKGITGLDAPSAPILADGTRLPLPDASMTHVILSEILEHVHQHQLLLAEAARVLVPGGRLAVSVPRWFPERVCWLLSKPYHQVAGGHIRIYRRTELRRLITGAGLVLDGHHHAHGLHAPYWWLKCLVGVDRETRLVRHYHDLLVHEIIHGPWPTPALARALDAVVGKSLVVYARKPQ